MKITLNESKGVMVLKPETNMDYFTLGCLGAKITHTLVTDNDGVNHITIKKQDILNTILTKL